MIEHSYEEKEVINNLRCGMLPPPESALFYEI